MILYQTRTKANADGLLGDMTITLDMPTGTVIKLTIAALVVFAGFYSARKYLS